MFKNYLKTAWRSIVRNKAFSLINITGLSIGMAASLLVFIVVQYELSYDKFQPNYNRIYRVVTQDKFDKDITYNAGIPVPALKALRAEFPHIQFGALESAYGSQITVPSGKNETGNKFIVETGLFFIEPQLFEVFSYQWLTGSPASLKDPNNVVLDEKTATKYFGSWQEAMGKTVLLDNTVPLKVNGILKNVPANSDLPLSVLVSYETLKQNGGAYNHFETWNTTSSNFNIMALLPANVKMDDINRALLQFSRDQYKPLQSNSIKTNFLQPLSSFHFDRRFASFGDHVTSKSTLLTLSLIGIFIILMACVNFINLATALSVNRSKEVGIRKVLGGNRSQLFGQVMTETAVIVCLSILVSLGIAWMMLPYIKHIASIQEQLSLFTLQTVVMVVSIGIIVTLLAGLYPSFVLSKYNPITALKNKMASAGVRGVSLRRGLVIMQFTISQVLIIATAVAISQMNFISKAELGFNKEGVLILNGKSDSISLSKQTAFKQQLLQIPGVQSVSFNNDAPSSDNLWSTNFGYNHQPDEKFQISLKFTDADYVKTFGLQLIGGRIPVESDTMRELMINETLVKDLGIKDPNEVIGKTIRIGRDQWYPIVGVVKDFKTSSLREDIKPVVITTRKKFYYCTGIKIRTQQLAGTQAAIQKTWEQFYPEYAYSPQFFDENIARFYQQEEQLSLLYKIFAGLAIFISCLGLYGLVSFMAVQKTKEVGIRKVLGASVTSLLQLFSKEFTVLIIVSFFIAVPVAWYMMHSWLNNFAYRIPLSIWFFITAIAGSVVIAWITVGYKAIRAALANPVKALRSE
ncbi:ABC transporter permease [Niastella yeongjuensis]|uniref:ABC transporter permease n=1 Tax=Niastella yeongjuensis TaxID=354355 RepID=A0A1V9E1H1_9BACT|nr:ABC transporter permease [Niastella yeongjuensis]OQP39911.1 ABC transporter permease [Niastella yeongjuensis]SEO09911.1 duplicated orphan permease [Niastella yeongjuensis]